MVVLRKRLMSYSHHPFKNKKCLPKLPKAGLGKQGNLIEVYEIIATLYHFLGYHQLY